MKKYIIIPVIGLLIFSYTTHAQTKSFKRGTCFNNLLVEDIEALSPGLSWAYNWALTSGNYDNFKNNGVEYLPMIWNRVNVTNARNFLSTRPEIKYILTFNEPNFKSQANLTPVEAARQWPEIEEIANEFNLTIVGPAVNYSPDKDPFEWYDEFFAACPDCRVDHIAVHLYMPSASSIRTSIEKFKKYGRPIWLTEFCAWENATTAKSQKQLLVDAFDYLETDPDIIRYAWFKERGAGGGHPYYQLLDQKNEGVLTELGEIFTYMSSYDDNFYFTTGIQIPSEHYIRMNRVNMEKTTDESGHINLSGMNAPLSWVDYNLDIPESGEYNIFFRLSAEYGDDSEVYVSVNGVEAASMLFEKKGVGVWNTQSCKGTFSEGKQKIRIGFKKGGLRLNWWAITKNNDAPSAVEIPVTTGDRKVYPNPVTDILHIQPADNISGLILSDINGRTLFERQNANDIDMTGYRQGIYLLTIKFSDGETIVKKVIKQ